MSSFVDTAGQREMRRAQSKTVSAALILAQGMPTSMTKMTKTAEAAAER
jgi:hypothetical protein